MRRSGAQPRQRGSELRGPWAEGFGALGFRVLGFRALGLGFRALCGFRVFWIFWRGAGREEFQRDLVGLAWQGIACGLGA